MQANFPALHLQFGTYLCGTELFVTEMKLKNRQKRLIPAA
jgi:hypothetical protein